MKWEVLIKRKVTEKVSKMPVKIRDMLNALVSEIEQAGPVRGNWPNYGKLDEHTHHCHIT
jgi:mRNA-degrading endonuclease RelE of RelBE toxin-antitoxin system